MGCVIGMEVYIDCWGVLDRVNYLVLWGVKGVEIFVLNVVIMFLWLKLSFIVIDDLVLLRVVNVNINFGWWLVFI